MFKVLAGVRLELGHKLIHHYLGTPNQAQLAGLSTPTLHFLKSGGKRSRDR